MKKSLIAFVLAALVGAPSAFAGGDECGAIFSQIDTWLAGSSHQVRVVTTMTRNDNQVLYTRGYLEESENVAGTYVVDSAFYLNDGAPENPFQKKEGVATLTLKRSDSSVAQLIYAVPGEPDAAYLVRCFNGMLSLVTSNGTLTASFRYSN